MTPTDETTHASDAATNALVNAAIASLNGLAGQPDGRARCSEVLAWLVRHLSAEAWLQYQHYQARCYAANPDAAAIPPFSAWLAERLWIKI